MVKNLPAMQKPQETQVRSLDREDPRRRKWQLTPVFLLGESHGQRSLAGYGPWGRRVGHDWKTNAYLLPHISWDILCWKARALSRDNGAKGDRSQQVAPKAQRWNNLSLKKMQMIETHWISKTHDDFIIQAYLMLLYFAFSINWRLSRMASIFLVTNYF